MEIIVLSIMIFGLITVFTIDARQKRHKYLNEGK